MGNIPSSEALELPRLPQKLSKTKNTKQLSEDSLFDYRQATYPTAASTLRQTSSKNSDSWPFVSSTYEIEESALRTSSDIAPQHFPASSRSAAPLENTTSSDRIAHLHGHRYLMDPAKAYGTHPNSSEDTCSHQQESVVRPQLYTTRRRRSSSQVPGVATRMDTAHSGHSSEQIPGAASRIHNHSASSKSHPRSASMPSGLPYSKPGEQDRQADGVAGDPLRPLPSLTDHAERCSTPCEESYRQLGGISFGTLRITNGSPVPSLRDSPDQTSASSTAIASPASASSPRSETSSEYNSPLPPQNSWDLSSLWADLPRKSHTTTSYPRTANNNSQTRSYAFRFHTGESLDARNDSKVGHKTKEFDQTPPLSPDPCRVSRSDSSFASNTSDEITRQTLSSSDSGYSSNLSLKSEKGSSIFDTCHDGKLPVETNRGANPFRHADKRGEAASSEDTALRTNSLNSRQPHPNRLKSQRKASFQTRKRENKHQREPSSYFEPIAKPVSKCPSRRESETGVSKTSAQEYGDSSAVPAIPQDVERSLSNHINWLQTTSSGRQQEKRNRQELQTIDGVDRLTSQEPSTHAGRAHNLVDRSVVGSPGDEPLLYNPNFSKKLNYTSSTYGQQAPSHGQYHTQNNTKDPPSKARAMPAPEFLRQQTPDHRSHLELSNHVRTAASMTDIDSRRKGHGAPPISLRNRKSRPSLDNFEAKSPVFSEDPNDQLDELFFEPKTEKYELPSHKTPDFPLPELQHSYGRCSERFVNVREPAYAARNGRFALAYQNKFARS